MALSFLTDRGIEGYQYAWGEHEPLDGSKPLELAPARRRQPAPGRRRQRQKVNVEDYDLLVKWVKTGYGYFKEFGLPAMPEKEREKAEKFLDAALPLVERMDKANREMLIPALADGQSALVIDGKLTSKHFVERCRPPKSPCP